MNTECLEKIKKLIGYRESGRIPKEHNHEVNP